MMSFGQTATRPHVYHGNLAFNQRTISKAIEDVCGADATGNDLTGTPMGLEDLTSLMLVLESLAMSNTFILDGTLPPSDIEQIQVGNRKLGKLVGIELGIEFAKPPRKKLASVFGQAFEAASILIGDELNATFGKERPLTFKNDDEERKFRDLLIWGVDAPEEGRSSVVHEIADVACTGRDSFRGSKCIAGYLCASLEEEGLRARIADCARRLHGDDFRRFASFLVNRFRINYINALAETKKAAYLADVSVENLKSAQVVLFWRYLLKKAKEQTKVAIPNTPEGLLDQKISATPLGFAILLRSSGTSPFDLFAEALSLRDARFAKLDAKLTKQQRYLHELDESAFGEFQDYLYRSDLMQAVDRDRRENLTRCTWREIRFPVATATFAFAMLSSLATGPVATGLGALGSYLLSGLVEDAAAGKWKRHRVLADSYRRVSETIHVLNETPDIKHALVDRVERTFGRTLVI